MFAMIYTELDHKIGEKEKYFGPFTSYSSLKTFILPSEKKSWTNVLIGFLFWQSHSGPIWAQLLGATFDCVENIFV